MVMKWPFSMMSLHPVLLYTSVVSAPGNSIVMSKSLFDRRMMREGVSEPLVTTLLKAYCIEGMQLLGTMACKGGRITTAMTQDSSPPPS